ncbi:ABC transporter permease [Ferrimonas balearica]|uniref:ABC transporter permease n=1 Tax=Ferrimonas balearica TaxID=44012 RepID=UPI001C59FD32|nr:ABC transporter permease [Ferrimonas balearica]MBW3139208.1 ABC transporter permease [Ferrimonas balearica]MBY6106272.1 ABC transporter permease [Ferrimonas balearica]
MTLFNYYLKLAWLSVRQSPVISTLMVLAIAIGIGTAGTSLTVHHTMSHNPMAHKDDQLYAVQLQSHEEGHHSGTEDGLYYQITYQDAINLSQQSGPVRQAAMIRTGFTVQPENPDQYPFIADGRATGRDFFAMFDATFLHGAAWTDEQGELAEPVTVISQSLNDKLFGGGNNVGRTIDANGKVYTVVGIIADYKPQPLFYDVNNGAFHPHEEMFIPFSLLPVHEIAAWGNTDGWKQEMINSYADRLNSELYWVQYWVELRDSEHRDQYHQQLAAYIDQQQEIGRFTNPDAVSELRRVSEWLEYNEVVSEDNRILLALSFLFLAVCLVNMVGLLLAKFLRHAANVGIRRALGASRGQVMAQHLTEVGLIGLLGGLLGSVFALIGLAGLRQLYPGYDQLARMDLTILFSLLTLALCAALLAGLFPAWRIGRTNPAHYLKSQ